ncbi:MAG: FAD-dependent thymidylate synthase [Anaerolineaceae bacterium]|nr:FAD-dependent thymidylate synthase [Anaerolineaceae bacterium]
MPLERKVYILDPQQLSPETIAVTFAKTSRSPLSFKEIASELTDEKSAEFHEKWVVGFGHASVAEHAVLHIAIENISRLAVETLESSRLASYTEKSTRYQKWEKNLYYLPNELKNNTLINLYETTCKQLFDTYSKSIVAVNDVIAIRYPRRDDESEAEWERRLRPYCVDVCRFLLPSASLANVGTTINARSLEHIIRKLLSSPLEEVRSLGQEIKNVSQAEVPTLVKYADASPYLIGSHDALTIQAHKVNAPISNQDWCKLIHYNPEGEEQILAASLYRFGQMSYSQALDYVHRSSFEDRQDLARALLGNLGPHDIPIRELEYAAFTFDLILDQGAYFELKRHRMMTQTPQALSTIQGYVIPQLIYQADFLDQYRKTMDAVGDAYSKISEFSPYIASYIVPNAYKRRVLITFNLRTAFHLISLRSAPNAHFSIRLVARRLAEMIRIVSPILSTYMQISDNETWKEIEDKYFFAE